MNDRKVELFMSTLQSEIKIISVLNKALRKCCEASLQVNCGAALTNEERTCPHDCKNCQYNDVDRVIQYFIREAMLDED